MSERIEPVRPRPSLIQAAQIPPELPGYRQRRPDQHRDDRSGDDAGDEEEFYEGDDDGSHPRIDIHA